MASVDRAKDNRTFTFSVSTKGTQCFAINCSNYQNPTSKLNGVTFHRFPNKQKELHKYLIWERNCRRRDKKPSIRSLLCSDHFNNDCMDRTGQTVRLKSDAVPTNFNVPEHLQTVSFCERRSDNSKRARLEDLEAVIYDEPTHVSNSDILYHKKDHPYALDIEMVKDKIVYLETRVQDLQKKARNATIREGRAKATCKLHIQKLKNQNLINAELETKLAAYQDIPLDLFHKPHGEYTEEQRNFSLTLHLYSPKAYEFLRTVLPLPAGRSLRRWLENIEAEPGISTCMINTLIKKKDENPDEYTHCSLMLDAMAIRKQVTYDSHAGKLVGFVDLGTGIDETDEAKEALVFMLVGIKSKWKAPVAYYLSKGLQAEVQAELLVGCIEKLSECGFVIHSVTMDGHASNISMCHLLGCNFEYHQQDPKPFFQLPGITNRIWVVMDACHMVKLIRNALEAYGTLMSAKGAIKWDHIRQLNEVQEEIGLRLGNRLSANHLAFKQQIMKVSLAVQTLSNSVARALETAEELGVQGFHLCEQTIEFIEVIDRLFDILNSRSPYGKGYKKPLTPHNIQYIMEFLF
ncbi:hypothetical protein SNE40_021216 [Patella caerulea]|uniref:THAP-type domain-containing protein n=1 Tax=Patella caerulea TaxID=87958 RepID=A0AAN8G3W7_PATCE